MPDPRTTVDQETVYRLLVEERWSDLLALVHRERAAIGEDELLSHAVDVFVSTFFDRFDPGSAGALRTELETLFLLHAGGHYRLRPERFETVVEQLARLHEDRPEAAAGFARHRPENPYCARILERVDVRRTVDHELAERVRVDETRPSEADHTIRLFRSKQEEAFFFAVREVFASYFAYPNVVLSALLDFEGLRPVLSAEERQFFFRGLVDCVVFDQHEGYRPRYFFEVDSPHHDAADRKANDGMKDRILAAAGQKLIRVRPVGRRVSRSEFVRILRDVTRDDPV